MIDISLENLETEDINAILYLRKMGVPDEIIQQAYENTIQKLKKDKK